jgi:hypothetical protein
MASRRLQQQLDMSTSSEDTASDARDSDYGHPCKELQDSRMTILNYKLLEIKYSKLLKLFSESNKQLV